MTTATRTTTLGWWRLLLAAVAALLVSLLGVTSAWADMVAAAQTRVGASTPAVVNIVGPHECITAGQRWGNAPPLAVTTVGRSVAANAGGRVAPDLLRVGELKLPAVPKGSVGTPTQTGKGMEYVIPRGTPEISEKVASVRIMDPVTSGKYQYPNGYAVYMNRSGQAINPLTGQTIARTDPYAHIPLP